MNKDGEKAASMLQKAAGIAGVSSISGETISAQEAKLQGKIDQGKQLIKDVIAENSETRKLIDDREKAEKTMHSKESTAEKAEKKSDEKAPQYRDDANKAAEDFRLVDGQLMDRLRSWSKTRADVFSRVVTAMTEVLTAPNNVGAGGGGGGGNVGLTSGGGGGFGVVAAKTAASSSPRQQQQPSSTPRSSYSVPVPRDVSGLSRGEQETLAARVRDTLGKAQRERDELQKLADVLKGKDPDAHTKAMAEVAAVAGEVAVLENDLRRLEKAQQAAVMPPATLNQSVGEVRARALYDFAAERDEELSLKAGDIVVVLDEEDEGWWEVMKVSGETGGGAAGAGGAGVGAHGSGATGFVPGSCVDFDRFVCSFF
jgi:hypothetical protein